MAKRIVTFGLMLLMLLSVSASVVACADEEKNTVPEGTYSCIAADTGEKYIFKGRTVRVMLYIMGKTAIDYSGTYRLKDGEITFDFPKDVDDIYNGTFRYELSEDGTSIVIGETVFTKE